MDVFDIQFNGKKYIVCCSSFGISIMCNYKRQGRYGALSNCFKRVNQTGALYRAILKACENKLPAWQK